MSDASSNETTWTRFTPSRWVAALAAGLGVALFLSLFITAAPVHAQSGTIFVDVDATGADDGSSWSDAYNDLQDALTAAGSGDEIWVAEGVYVPGSAVSDTFTIPAGVALYGGFAGTEAALSQRDWRAYRTILSGDVDDNDINSDGNHIAEDWNDIQGDNAYHVVWLDGTTTPITESTRLDGFVVTAGEADGEGLPLAKIRGGGLYCDGDGGTCNPTLTNLLFSGNFADDWGGAMFNNGYSGTSSPTLINVIFRGNAAEGAGGAMYNYNRISGSSSPTLINVAFWNNEAYSAGALRNDGTNGNSSPTLINVTFYDNRAAQSGGAIVNDGSGAGRSDPTLTNVIFWGNDSETNSGDQIFNYYATTTIAHSLVEGGLSGGIRNYGSGSGVTDGGGNLSDDPRFVSAPNGDFRLQGDSPAIDAGDNAPLPADVTTDLAGEPRRVDGDEDGNPIVDMGAYENQAGLLFVDQAATGTGTGLSWTNAYTTVQAALDRAVTFLPTDTVEIWVATGVYTPGTAEIDTFAIPAGVALYGGFPTGGGDGTFAARDWAANPTVLSGDLDGDDTDPDGDGVITDPNYLSGTNAYHVVWMDGTTTPITGSTRLDGFTITAGQANGSGPHDDGGGLYCNGRIGGTCNPTLTNLTFSGNVAIQGGALYNDGRAGESNPTLTNVVFRHNAAPSNYGGAMYNDGSSSGDSSPTLTNVVFYDNTARSGGAIYMLISNNGNSDPTLTNVTFSENHATFTGIGGGGSVLYSEADSGSSSDTTMTNAILWGNSDPSNAISLRVNATVTISHSLVQGGWSGTGNINADPRFVDAANGDLRVGPGSPAIDAGDNGAVPATVTTDLAGEPRFVDGDGDGTTTVDMGAYETRINLALAKSVTPDPVVAGTGLTTTLVVTNRGTLDTDAVLSDTLPPSVTLRVLDQTDNTGSEFNAGAQANTRWHDPVPERGGEEHLTLSDTLQVTGVFTSRVFDAGNVVPWETLHWTPRRPTGKPLPDGGAAETAYALGDVTMVGNRVLLHLDDDAAPFADTSGYDHDGTCTAPACPTPGADGRFHGALAFDGLDDRVTVPDAHSPTRYALEAWVYPETVTDTSVILRTDAVSGTAHLYAHLLGIRDDRFVHLTRAGDAVHVITGTTAVVADTWYHVVGTAESGGELKLYVNGQEEARAEGLGPLWSGGDRYVLGAAYGDAGTTAFHGRLDEVAVYSRTLSAAEVTNRYLRGALQLAFDVRTCDLPDCSDGTWHGPYTEADDPDPDLPRVTLALPDARYAQYRATLTTTDPAHAPALHRVSLGPDHYDVTAEPAGQCAATSGAFTCALGPMAPDSVVTVTARSHVDPSALGLITNTAAVTTTGEMMPTDNVVTVTTPVTSEVGLSLAKYDDARDLPHWHAPTYGMADPVNPGSPLTYTLLIHNHGPSTAWNVTVTDTITTWDLPIPLDFFLDGTLTIPEAWDCALTGDFNAILQCTIPALRPGRHTIVATGATPAIGEIGGTITNTAWITAAGSTVLTATSTLSDSEPTTLMPLADLTVAKTAAPDPVNPGETLTFTVHVTNTGPYTATDVVVTDTLPAGLTGHPVAGSAWTACSAPGSQVTCTLAEALAPTDTASFPITTTAPLSGLIENHAVVASNTFDPDQTDNETRRYVTVRPVADLSVAKGDTPDPVDAASPLTYTVVVTNAGPVDAGALTTTVAARTQHAIDVPIGGTARPYPSTLWLNSVPGRVQAITVTLYGLQHTYPGDLVALLTGPEGQSTVLMANAGGGADADDLTLTFHDTGERLPVSDPLTTTTYRPTNHGFGESLPAPAPAAPYGSGFAPFYGGSPNGAWRLHVYDTFDSDGGRIADGWGLDIVAVTTETVTLRDTLPAGLTNVTPDLPGWDCAGGPDVVCQAQRLERHETVTLTLSATAPITPGVITNTAHVTSTLADLNPTRNTALVTTTVTPVADLALTKTAHAAQVGLGRPLTYTLTVSNAGPSPLLSTVVVTDTLPVDLTDVATSADCDLAALPTVTCSLDGLDVGATAQLTFTARAPLTRGVITNTASVTAPGIDPDPLNNTDAVTLTVKDIAITDLVAANDSPNVTGTTTTLWASIATGTNVTYAWALGDGTTATGASITHTYPTIGTYTAVVTATNSVSQVTATTVVEIIDWYTLHLPLMMRTYVAAPDLVVERLVATSDAVTVTIKNDGDAPVEDHLANEFWVDVYVAPATPPTSVNQTWQRVGDQGLVWGVTQDALPLKPGDVLTLTVDDPYYYPDESTVTWPLAEGTPVYAQVDSAHAETDYGAVRESHEIIGQPYNNVLGPVSSIAGSTQRSSPTAFDERERPLSAAHHLPPRP